MKMFNDEVRIVPYEPATHWGYVYTWFHSGDYDYFFGNMPLLNTEDSGNFNSNGINYIILDAKDVKNVIGFAAVNMLEERHRNCHFGLLIDKRYQGKGLGSECTRMVVNRIFNFDNYFKIICRVDPENVTSKKGAISVGFEEEARLKQDVYYNGEFHDIIRMKLTKGMFNKKYKKSKKAGQVEAKK